MISPYYDSLLVKVTAWGPDFKQACQRMDRALREFRIRGVKTNIPFLENVVNIRTFQSGEMTTSFLDETPELFEFKPRRDRATKLLSYLARRDRERQSGSGGQAERPTRDPRGARAASRNIRNAPEGTRQLLDRVGPGEIRRVDHAAETAAAHRHDVARCASVAVGDARAHVRPAAHCRLRCQRTAAALQPGDVGRRDVRRLDAVPAGRSLEAAAALREKIPNICFQMLLRASNAVGYTAYPDNVVREFIKEAAAQGIDIFRIFDSLNWMPNMQVAVEATLKTGRVCEAAICYTGDILDPKREKYSLEYYVRLAKELERMGTHILGIKDMAGLLQAVRGLQAGEDAARRDRAADSPAHARHQRDQCRHHSEGRGSGRACRRRRDLVHERHDQPAESEFDRGGAGAYRARYGLDFRALNQLLGLLGNGADVLLRRSTKRRNPARAEVYIHEMPGGQYTNLKEQAEAMGLGGRWPEVARMYADVNMAFGDIVKVTPSSKVVGDLALFLVSHDMTVQDLENLPADHH